MRRLLIKWQNGNIYDADIDDNTAIGIDFQCYDLKEPAKRKINISNNFSIPVTAKNKYIFGFPGNVHTSIDKVFEKKTCDYWIDNEQFIKDANIRIESVTDERINLICCQKNSFWDEIKTVNWLDFEIELLQWLIDQYSYPSQSSPLTGSIDDFVSLFVNNTEGLIIPFYFSSMYQTYTEKWSSDVILENHLHLALSYIYDDTEKGVTTYHVNGGHFACFVKTIFKFIEQKFSINLFANGGSFSGNIFDDDVLQLMLLPVRSIYYWNADTVHYLRSMNYDVEEPFPTMYVTFNHWPHKDVRHCDNKTVYDFVLSFFQHLNIIVEETDDGIKLRRFDDIMTKYGEVIDFSGLAQGEMTFKPYIDNSARNNYIKFKATFELGNEYANSKNIVCDNQMLDERTNIIEIDAYQPGQQYVIVEKESVPTDYYVPDLSTKESFKTFTFLIIDTVSEKYKYTKLRVYKKQFENVIETSNSYLLKLVQSLSLEDEYQLFESIYRQPRYFEVEKWLTLSDMRKFKYTNLYYFKELNGAYFINKISGFNPHESNAPTKLELIYVGNYQPQSEYITDYWVDGVEDIWTDGINDYYY